MCKVSLSDYYDLLDRHDWFYRYSDDYSVYKSGERSEDSLRGMKIKSEKHFKLYEEMMSYKLQPAKHKKPQRPN